MTKKILTIAILSILFMNACNQSQKKERAKTNSTELIEKTDDDIVKSSLTDKDGEKLEMTFNNAKGTATLNFKGETIELVQERAASGIWYKNDTYELRGKGNDIDLKRDGELVFTHKDEIVNFSLKDNKENTLDMTYNNTANTVKIYLNGGDEIELKGQRTGSGIWYKNDTYELRGKGENLELTKDGKTVFKS